MGKRRIVLCKNINCEKEFSTTLGIKKFCNRVCQREYHYVSSMVRKLGKDIFNNKNMPERNFNIAKDLVSKLPREE